MEELRRATDRSPEEVAALRTKFVAEAKKYMGVPYSRRYHQTPDCKRPQAGA